ncbi:MAG: helix-turn-helix transcriptional regulator [Thiogranum sp.]|nr:helix-turn-helix transcriptional regulator [Thiogranum sp.]
MRQDVTLKAATRRILAANVRYLRLLRGWSQEQLAERCGLHRTYIGAIERGERNLGLDNLDRLAGALNTTASRMLQDPALPTRYQVREPAIRYRNAPPARLRPHQRTRRRTAAYLHQIATHSLSTGPENFLVMLSHESECKEASGAAGTPVAHQPRLVAGSAGRAQRP